MQLTSKGTMITIACTTLCRADKRIGQHTCALYAVFAQSHKLQLQLLFYSIE